VTGEEWITGLCQLVAKKQKEINQLKETKKALVESNAHKCQMIYDLKEELERLKNAQSK